MSSPISVVIPLYNEELNILPLLQSIYTNLEHIDYELILIDDGSQDATVLLLSQHKNSRTKIIVFDKNYGQSAAINAGLENSKNEIVVIMDGDLQNDASDIPQIVDMLLREGHTMVQGYRKQRHDNFSKTLPSKMANRLIRSLFGVPIHDIGCSLKAFKREAISSFVFFNGFHRYIPLFSHLHHKKIGEFVVKHHARHAGKSKYGLSRAQLVIRDLWFLKTKQMAKLPNISWRIKDVIE